MTLRIENTMIRLVDLLPPMQAAIDGLEATNVTFLGPAVMVLQGNIILNGDVRILDDVDKILWDIDDQRTTIVGAVGITNATFTNCNFKTIGIGGTHKMLTTLMERIDVTPPS